MQLSSRDPSAIPQIIERAIEKSPHVQNILKAFGPIIERQRLLVTASPLKSIAYSAVDKDKFKAGVPVIKQVSLLGSGEDLKTITLSLAPAVKVGMPELAQGIDRFCDLIRNGNIHLADYFKPTPEQEENISLPAKSDVDISPSGAAFLMSLVGRVVLEQRAREAATLDLDGWDKGYCPVCGDFPSIALIEEKGGKRFLHCSSCGHDWRFTRVVCPCCENVAPEGMDYFYIDNKTQEAAFICDKCQRYLVTLYRVGHLLERDMDVSAISLVHMDMIMQDKGYKPMTACLWNILK
jgi:FdhE protein